MAGLIVPGNLIIENGGKLISTGDLSWGHEDIYKDGADMIINGATVRVDGDVKVGGIIDRRDTSDAIVTG